MQLDQAQIAIHERWWLDNLDLALHVMRRHALGIAMSVLVGIVPVLLLNHAFLYWLREDGFDARGLSKVSLLIVLVMIEAPLATAPLTLYLGQILFVEKPRAGSIARDFVRCLPQLVVLQGILRVFCVMLVVGAVLLYAGWPYLNEVILLERNPLVGRGAQLSTMKRSRSLHRTNIESDSLLLRAIFTLMFVVLLCIALQGTVLFLARNLFGYELHGTWAVLSLQIVLWTVVVYFTVARFLAYLDQRIRNEGWEVELLLRAQRDRLMKQTV